MKTPIIYLHGFLGFYNELDPIFKDTSIKIIGIDWYQFTLSKKTISMLEIAKEICDQIRKLGYESVNIIGYSMGGRLALQCAAIDPGLIKALYLESCHFGYKNNLEKNKSFNKFLAQFKQIKKLNSTEFLSYWYNQSLFSLTKKSLKDKKYKNKLCLDFELSKKIMYACHVSKQPYFVDILNTLSIPIHYVTGKEDIKYSNQATQIATKLHKFKYSIIENADHNVHISNEIKFKQWLMQKLTKSNRS